MASTGEVVAVKFPNAGQDLHREAAVATFFHKQGHPNMLAPLFFTGPKPNPSSLAFPVLLGSLEDLRKGSSGMFPKHLAKSIARGIAHGLSHMHEHSFIHRDLKAQNVLMGVDDAGILTPRIADFGWSRSLSEMNGEGASKPPLKTHD